MKPDGKKSDTPSFLIKRFHILHKSSEVYAQLEYIRSRLRIARASVFNSALTPIAVLLFTWFQLGSSFLITNKIVASIIVFLAGVVLTIASYQSWKGLVKSYSISTWC
jgi:hypothetical protein